MSVETDSIAQPAPESSTRGIVGAATILAAGNIASRVLGLGREIVIYDLFGATGYVSVLKVASTLVITLYDFLVGGLITAALVPVLSEYAADPSRRREFWNLVSTVLSVIALLLALAVLGLELLAEPLFVILGAGYDEQLRAVGVQMIRLILPAVFFIGMAGVLSGVLFALKNFTLPAFITAAFNLSIIVCALALTPVLGITSAVLGVVVGAASQVVLQAIGLRNASLRVRFDLRHPALKQIGRLYVPVLGGLTIALIGVAIDRNLTSRTGDQSLAWMQAATYLVQLPLGLVTTAISFAILPTLSRAGNAAEFRKLLAFGLKLVLLLILPAVVGLFVLATPVVELVFQHGAFTASDTAATARALQFYLFGTAFAAIDQPLVFAFYARKNTLLPNLVAVVALGIYLVVAFALIQPLGYLGLVLANSAQLAGHAVVMLWFTRTRLGGIGGEGVGTTTLKLLLASAAMGAAMFFVPPLDFASGVVLEIGRVLVPALLGGIVYVIVLKVLRVRELDQLVGVLQRRARRGRG
ncbi:MAG: murein biosynthesis integral membrane protein MurJ [Chloroflexi bacterium]|nr:murein biosynthesis integral membrane protein MurJ [Chloroflexota bacterium]